MLQKVHEYTHGWFAWIVISLVSITFVMFGVSSYLNVHRGVDSVAMVGDTPITSQDLKTATERLRREYQMSHENAAISADRDQQLQQQALEGLITNTVLTQTATSAGFNVSTEQAEQALMKFPAFQKEGRFSNELFEQALRYSLHSPQSFVQQIREDMIVGQLEAGIRNSSFVLPTDLQTTVALLTEKRDIHYAVLPVSQFKSSVVVTDQEMQAYYKAHANEFQVPESVQLEYVTIGKEDLLHGIHISDQEIEAAYKENQSSYQIPQQWRVAQILVQVPFQKGGGSSEQAEAVALRKATTIKSRLDKGEDFSAVAKSSSEDISSKAGGGVLPWIKHGTLDSRFESAVANLKVGEISEPVRTQYGYNIIKLLETKASSTAPLSSVRAQIKQQLEQNALQKTYENINEDLSNLAFMQPDSLQGIAAQYQRPIQTSSWLSRSGGGDDEITRDPRVISAAFSSDVLEEGNNSEVIPVRDNTLLVLRVKQHQPPSTQDFDTVKASIREALIDEKAKAIALQKASILLSDSKKSRHQDEKWMDTVIWKTANNLLRGDKDHDPTLVKAAFMMPAPSEKQAMTTMVTALPNNEVAAIQCTRVIKGNIETLSASERDSYEQLMAYSQSSLEFQLFVSALLESKSIQRTPSAA